MAKWTGNVKVEAQRKSEELISAVSGGKDNCALSLQAGGLCHFCVGVGGIYVSICHYISLLSYTVYKKREI